MKQGPYSLSAILLATPVVIADCVRFSNLGGGAATAADLTFAQVQLYLNRNVASGGAVNPLGQTAFRVLDNVTTAYLRKIFVDLVCIVAWYFRATGHHYNAEADERIGRVWDAYMLTKRQIAE